MEKNIELGMAVNIVSQRGRLVEISNKTNPPCWKTFVQDMSRYCTCKTLFFCSCLSPVHRPCCPGLVSRTAEFPSRNTSWLKRRRNISLSTVETLMCKGEPQDHPQSMYSTTNMHSPDPKNVMDFFRLREGHWSSWRVTHHLAFRRDEQGFSNIFMQVLDKSDPRIVELCEAHQVDPNLASGGCYVEWAAQMSWDQEGENHEGSTVFAIIPDDASCCSGKLLRDRGYAEIVQVAGTFRLTPGKELVLHTPYDGGDVEETFSFIDKNIVIRSSTVKRFGGFSTATFSTELRKTAASIEDGIVFTEEMMPFGGPSMAPKKDESHERQWPRMTQRSSQSMGALDFL
ncbi:hypothetical protein GpartN1_g7553.t1 [Galdieria partita]|uniref:Chromophore lyase CpcS/CpeS n=1 Tax=Galdieria partita TaxID=83374 RepID=A0A9C7Q702_9RHOD|nr:hypothetical protein GpartN1_g7553.t1 [Galdieria partita]